MKTLGGRFESGPSEVFERFSGSLDFDRETHGCRYPRLAGVRACAGAVGILTAGERERIVAAFDQIRQEPVDPTASDEDIHTYVIRKLKEHAGAGSRQDPYRPQP